MASVPPLPRMASLKSCIPKILVFLGAAVVYLLGQYFRGIWFEHFFINTCAYAKDQWGVFCNSPYSLSLGFPLILAGEVFAIAGIIMLFATEQAWRKWLWMSAFFIPISAILINWIYPFGLPPGITVPISSGVAVFGRLYIIITLGIVIQGYFAARRNK